MKKFLLGILTVACILPILDGIVELIMSWIEVLKINPTKIILSAQSELQDLQAQNEYQSTSAIGFEVPTDEEYYDYEEDKQQVGFH